MIAHSFRGKLFGPAQALHGATFVIDAAFMSEKLDANGVVVDIGRAHGALKGILARLITAISTSCPNSRVSTRRLNFWRATSMTGWPRPRAGVNSGAPTGSLGRSASRFRNLHVARAWYEASLW